jgi:tartrate dehydratase beta subunit/fumarate hydratase class I family protein
MNAKILNTPLTGDNVRSLKAGDLVYINGRIVTGRDRIHKFLFNMRPEKKDIPFELEGSILYHCGPIIKTSNSGYSFVAGGPTTSYRLEMYEWRLIRDYGINLHSYISNL